jgi:23S rRNA (adenine2503-C2)-methyltransferase
MGCRFCASTLDGLVRPLTPSEMLGQIYLVQKETGKKISNIVVMGSGEPLEYLDKTLDFITLLNSPKGQNIGQRHITVSTCGLVPQIYELADKGLQITLAISLHAATDLKRKEIMPVAYQYSLKELMAACKYYTQKTKRRITYEYALIAGVNDTKEDAWEIIKLLKGTLSHVNLIPINPIEERAYKTSDKKSVEQFCAYLTNQNIEATVRRKLGEDIDAACGQLRRSYLNNRGE